MFNGVLLCAYLVCLWAWVYVCECVCVCVCVCVRAFILIQMHACLNICDCVYMCMSVCVYARECVCAHVHVYMHVGLHMYVYVYVFVCMFFSAMTCNIWARRAYVRVSVWLCAWVWLYLRVYVYAVRVFLPAQIHACMPACATAHISGPIFRFLIQSKYQTYHFRKKQISVSVFVHSYNVIVD